MGESASTGAKLLPEGMETALRGRLPRGLHGGCRAVFAVAALVALACAILAWLGLRPGVARIGTTPITKP